MNGNGNDENNDDEMSRRDKKNKEMRDLKTQRKIY
jgi:hypothetical protein